MKKSLIAIVGWFTLASSAAADPAEEFRKLLQRADAVSIEFIDIERSKEVVTFRDDVWLTRLSLAVATAPFERKVLCRCVSSPRINLFQAGERIASISVHHDERVRIFGSNLGGDFFVRADVGQAIRGLANERKAANQPSQPTPVNRRG